VLQGCFIGKSSTQIIVQNSAMGKIEDIAVSYTLNGTEYHKKINYVNEDQYNSVDIHFPRSADQQNVIPFTIMYTLYGEECSNEYETIIDPENPVSELHFTDGEVVIIDIHNTYFFVLHKTKDEYTKEKISSIGGN
jgi:hypothetical protein